MFGWKIEAKKGMCKVTPSSPCWSPASRTSHRQMVASSDPLKIWGQMDENCVPVSLFDPGEILFISPTGYLPDQPREGSKQARTLPQCGPSIYAEAYCLRQVSSTMSECWGRDYHSRDGGGVEMLMMTTMTAMRIKGSGSSRRRGISHLTLSVGKELCFE